MPVVLAKASANGYGHWTMKHAPSPLRPDVPKLPPDATDAEFEAWMEALPPCPGIPSTEEEVAAADARALEDIAAGRVHDHAVVAEWLKTWGTPDQRSFKEWLNTRDA